MAVPASLYELLEVKPDSGARTIRAAYRRLAWQYHPDVGGSQQAMAELNGAWQILRDPETRAQYDNGRSAANARAPGSQPYPATRAGPAPQRPGRDRPPAPRAASAPQGLGTDPPSATPTFRAPAAGPAAAAGKRTEGTPPGQRDASTLLDFGRYEGWSLIQLSVADPDYLEWLARTSIGRRLQPEIAALLASRRAGVAARQGASPQSPRSASRRAGARAPTSR